METNYINDLTEKQVKTLILLGFFEYNYQFEEEISYNIYNIDDIKLKQTKYKTALNYSIYNSNNIYKCDFLINDYSMFINDKGFSLDVSNVLKWYLAHEYGDEYINYLYNKRIKDAENEKDNLLKNSPNVLKEYGLEKLERKIKTIGTKN